jgi:hypothetical protein
MYEWYLGPPMAEWVTHVGKLELLPNDLAILLRILGYDWSFEDRPPMNCRPSCSRPIWHAKTLDKMLTAERLAIKRFHYDAA